LTFYDLQAEGSNVQIYRAAYPQVGGEA
jgi:hypothetical protein